MGRIVHTCRMGAGDVLHSKAARATQQAMAATAEAVAKLQLRNGSATGQSEAHQGGKPGLSSRDADNVSQEAQEEAVCGQIGQLLNPADSGYLADTEGQAFVLQPAEGKVESSNGAGVKHFRTRGPATRNSNMAL